MIKPTLAFHALIVLAGLVLCLDMYQDMQTRRMTIKPSVEVDSNEERNPYEQGVSLISKGKFEDALMYLNQAIASDPNRTDYIIARADAHAALNNTSLALEDIERAMSYSVDNVELLMRRVVLYRRLDRFDEALGDISKILSLEPKHVNAYFHRASIHYAQEKHEQALSELNIVIERKPDFAAAYFNRATIWVKLKNFDAALEDMNTYIEKAENEEQKQRGYDLLQKWKELHE